MNRRNRIFLGILLLFMLGVGFLLYRVSTDLDPRYRESAEDSLVDTSHLLASLIETDMRAAHIETRRLKAALDNAYARRFSAEIYGVAKRRVYLRIYVTDAEGQVLYDSTGSDVGKNYRAWRDVGLTLKGKYGARTTRGDPKRPETAVMYVAAPIYDGTDVVGVVSVGKAVATQQLRVESARRKLLYVGLITMAAFVILLSVLSVWLVRPFGLSADLLRILRQEGLQHPRRVLRRVATVASAAFRDMRDALAGRSYTEEYVQTLTHELKSPLAAIRGAAELLREDMPEAQRRHFSANIAEQVQRLQDLADRLLELSSLEKHRTLDESQPVDIAALAAQAAAALEPAAQRRGIALQVEVPAGIRAEGDPFLLHQALANLLANAIDFSPPGATIELSAAVSGRRAAITVRDHGPGVPDYAVDRVFEKFYSLRRPDSGRKSTGLGLAFVREIAHLHGGAAYLVNHPDGGVAATLSLPATSA